jgi:hypothetical protein
MPVPITAVLYGALVFLTEPFVTLQQRPAQTVGALAGFFVLMLLIPSFSKRKGWINRFFRALGRTVIVALLVDGAYAGWRTCKDPSWREAAEIQARRAHSSPAPKRNRAPAPEIPPPELP